MIRPIVNKVNKTLDYNRDIFRPPTLLQMRFQEILAFCMRSLSLCHFPSKKPDFSSKTLNFVANRHFLEILPFYLLISQNRKLTSKREKRTRSVDNSSSIFKYGWKIIIPRKPVDNTTIAAAGELKVLVALHGVECIKQD